MRRINEEGGLRLKLSKGGRVSKQEILSRIENMLDNLEADFGVGDFGGVNLYFQFFKNGERQALVNNRHETISGFDLSQSSNEKPISRDNYKTVSVHLLEQENSHRIQAQEAELRAIRAEYQRKCDAMQLARKNEEDQLERFKASVAREFSPRRIQDITSSCAKVIQKSTILSYISEDEVPSCGFVFRASMKDATTGTVSTVRIYDDAFNLIKVVARP